MRTVQQFGNVLGIGAGQFGDFLHLFRICSPGGLVGIVVGDCVEADFGKLRDYLRVFIGKILAGDPDFKGRRVLFADLVCVGEDFSGLADFPQRR